MAINIRVRTAIQPRAPDLRGRLVVTVRMIGIGSRISERVTKICQMTKLPLVILIRASPSDKARTVRMIDPTARRMRSDRAPSPVHGIEYSMLADGSSKAVSR